MSHKKNYMLYKTIICCLISKKIVCRIRKIICHLIFLKNYMSYNKHIYVV